MIDPNLDQTPSAPPPVSWGSLPGWFRILIIIHCIGTIATCIWAGAFHDRTWW